MLAGRPRFDQASVLWRENDPERKCGKAAGESLDCRRSRHRIVDIAHQLVVLHRLLQSLLLAKVVDLTIGV